MTTEALTDRLAAHRTLAGAPREELAWIASHCTYLTMPAGEVVGRPGEPADMLYIILEGRITYSQFVGTGQRKLAEMRAGEVGGLLPYSRLRVSGGLAVVEEAAEVLALARAELPGLIRHCPYVTEIMVHLMTDRARSFTSAELRNEKMISLGKLAAGLAHELNNPASAAVRDAKAMPDALHAVRDAAHALAQAGLSGPQLEKLQSVQQSCMTSSRAISGLALTDREEELAAWLRAHDLRSGLAEDLARVCIATDMLNGLADELTRNQLEVALDWIAAECAAQSLSSNIELAVTRIHALVASVKGFTRMDRAPDEGPVDVLSGLADSVALLNGKARKKSVTVNLNISRDLPEVKGIGAEVNQVWMNLIDNAVDAAPQNGHIDIIAKHEGPAVVVRVIDDGPGIPPEIKGSIFDPFFTTKGVGEGTGLGLDIVRRVIAWHNGQVEVETKPGRTEFLVRLPCSAI